MTNRTVIGVVLSTAAMLAAATTNLSAQEPMRGFPAMFRMAPLNVYPDSSLTPGEADTTDPADIQRRWPCPRGANKGKRTCTYSQAHRNVPNSVKNAVYAAYDRLYPGLSDYCHALDVPKAQRRQFTSGRNQRCELDHFCPVGGGCANSAQNLWIQRADTTRDGEPMGFHQKDDLEAWGIAQIKAGNLTPEEFDRRIWSDWVSYYLEVRPAHSNVSN
jgi:hypothetical protein